MTEKEVLQNILKIRFMIGQTVYYIFSKKQDEPHSAVVTGYEINTRRNIVRYQTDLFTLDDKNYALFDKLEEALQKLNEMNEMK